MSDDAPVSDLAEPRDPVADTHRALLTLLFNKYRGELFNYLARLVRSHEDAADLVQETYLRAMRQAPRGELEDVARAYLFQIATNLARDHFRRRRFREHSPLDSVPEPEAPRASGSPADHAHWEQVIESLAVVLGSMPVETREVFVRARLHGRSHAEIARELRISQRTVERRVGEAIGLLAARLEDLL